MVIKPKVKVQRRSSIHLECHKRLLHCDPGPGPSQCKQRPTALSSIVTATGIIAGHLQLSFRRARARALAASAKRKENYEPSGKREEEAEGVMRRSAAQTAGGRAGNEVTGEGLKDGSVHVGQAQGLGSVKASLLYKHLTEAQTQGDTKVLPPRATQLRAVAVTGGPQHSCQRNSERKPTPGLHCSPMTSSPC
ncbi:hypothetical protein SKAU_G00282840 [Synaphobranchus kaupii]|uniref:Uncharacterized protein n=1 Tax=Synaphobranchus kaupii TaxID=118154 RepID=A0A9Q1IP65_SYNKA|nr:hypothetical protein SKAU_G00282840 [Synaphobranchus kaupii]